MHIQYKIKHLEAIETFIRTALKEDIGPGDYSALACLNPAETGSAQLIVKDDCIIAGIEMASLIFTHFDPNLKMVALIEEGAWAPKGTIAFKVSGPAQSILATERLVLNCMQRMSGIATLTHKTYEKIKHTKCKILDTRKTTPNFRIAEKWAVVIGGGVNHRMGLYDMIMLKDNHIDYCGGISKALAKTLCYLKDHKLKLPIIVETRNLKEVEQCLESFDIERILLDNMSVVEMQQAVDLIDGRIPTEASGNITIDTIVPIAETGVDFISMGSITHSAPNIDLSLKAL